MKQQRLRQIIVIANCHSLSIARALALRGRNLDVKFIDVNFLGRENEQENIGLLKMGLDEDTIVFSLPTSSRLSPVSNFEVEQLVGQRLKVFTNIWFDGLHPDITYLRENNTNKLSLLGAYHSKIVLYAFSTGRTVIETVKLFDYKIYEGLGYFDIFNSSSNRLLERDRACDIKFASIYLESVRDHL